MDLPSISSSGGYSCESAAQTLEWMKAIADFLKPFKHLLDAHVVNFFKDRLWESVNGDWMEYLRREPVENLLKIPSGIFRESWPASLKEFICTSRALALPREPQQLQMVRILLPREPQQLQMMLPDMHLASIGSVLSQGMNMKKKHEVEILAAVVCSIANSVGAQSIIDVGAGQGYLAQVLSFEYQLSVMAIDASSHHGNITSARAERIKKHYAAKIQKSQPGEKDLKAPQTVTCKVLSSNTLKTLSASLLCKENLEPKRKLENSPAPIVEGLDVYSCNPPPSSTSQSLESSLLLAGLHACGDLSVTMLRTFLDCKEVKALISIGCCYNLLTEEYSEKCAHTCGFPLSDGAKFCALSLGKNARDLACQSAERWRSLTKESALQNFEVHAFRAAFQMVLGKYYPEVLLMNPSIGRQGKAHRRQQLRKALHQQLNEEKHKRSPSCAATENCEKDATSPIVQSTDCCCTDVECNTLTAKGTQWLEVSNKFGPFEAFCESGLHRLGLIPTREINLLEIWKEAQPFVELIGPYWSLRSMLGPVVETFLLLDRLLFLQEQHSSVLEVMLVPIFDPMLSPRNMAIIARKV